MTCLHRHRLARHYVGDACPGGHVDEQRCVCGHQSGDHAAPCGGRNARGDYDCWAPCRVLGCDCAGWFGRMGAYMAEATP